jgi:hypothetical protein
MFRWLHTHDLALVAETYAPPIAVVSMDFDVIDDALERIHHGCTTFVWKCSDPKCSKVVTQVVLGRRIP